MENKFNNIKIEAEGFFNGTNACHELKHTERVYNMAMHIGKKEKADLTVISLAAILHDIARKEQDESNGKIDHAERGAFLAREILDRHGIDKNIIDNVVHCIESHRYRKNKIPQTTEAKVIYDADKLDSIGAIGIGRAFSFAGHIGAKVHDKNVNLDKNSEYTQEDTAYREYLVKLINIKDKMMTNEGRRISEERHNFMEQFFNRINKEVEGEL